MSARKTQYQELGYRMDSPGNWRVVATETDQSIGPHYASKQELLADLPRYASEYGCAGRDARLEFSAIRVKTLIAQRDALAEALRVMLDATDGDAPQREHLRDAIKRARLALAMEM